MAYKIVLFPVEEWYVQLKLVDEFGKSITHNDSNISMGFLMQFESNILEQTIKETEQELSILDKVSKNQLYGYFAYKFIKNSWLRNYFNNFRIKYLNGVYNGDLSWMKEALWSIFNDSDEMFLIYREFFHLHQFINQEWYYNASSQLAKLTPKYKQCGEENHLDGLYYIAIDRIGQTIESDTYKKIKQYKSFSETYKQEMKEYIDWIFSNPHFASLLERKGMTHIAVVPNNYERPVSINAIMKSSVTSFHPQLSIINIQKNSNPNTTTQKSIKIFCDRLTNAELLFDIHNSDKIPDDAHVLIIDDVFWSGATINMVAKKIKEKNPHIKITGFALAGSYRDGFDVINEA